MHPCLSAISQWRISFSTLPIQTFYWSPHGVRRLCSPHPSRYICAVCDWQHSLPCFVSRSEARHQASNPPCHSDIRAGDCTLLLDVYPCDTAHRYRVPLVPMTAHFYTHSYTEMIACGPCSCKPGYASPSLAKPHKTLVHTRAEPVSYTFRERKG